MISIRKYLGQGSAIDAAGDELEQIECVTPLITAASQLCAGLERHIFDKPRFDSMRIEASKLRSLIKPGITVYHACEICEALSELLQEYEFARDQAAAKTGAEMQSIVAMLNQAVITLAAGNERSVTRLQTIQDSLQHTSRLRDLVAMRSSLSDALKFVQSENALEQEMSRRDLALLQADISSARELVAEARGELQGRNSGVRAMTEAASQSKAPEAVFAAAFRVDRMRGLVQRYGPEVAEELLFLLMRERVHRLSDKCLVYRWNTATIVSLLTGARELEALRDEVCEQNRQPLVHRISVGDRMATMTLTPSYLVCQVARGTLEATVEELDRFAMMGE